MNLAKLAILGLLGVSALVLSGCDLLGKYGGGTPSAVRTQQETSTTGQGESGEEMTITFSDSGVTPAQVTVKSGGSIKWINNSSVAVQAASGPHPTHTANPEITSGNFVLELAPGASASVTVTKIGTWGFHNHLDPAVSGKLVVDSD